MTQPHLPQHDAPNDSSYQFEYEVHTVFTLTRSDIKFLMLCCLTHYDSTCRGAGRPGPGGFIYGASVALAFEDQEQAAVRVRFTSRQLNLTCKILEQTRTDNGLGARFRDMFHAAAEEYKRVNKCVDAPA